MNSKRIKCLTEFVNKDDTVLDVGCDHGYLSILLKKEKLCKEVYASDSNSNALDVAKKNFQKYNVKIKTFISDGFKNIPVFFDTAVIAGMGCDSILNILKFKKIPKLILCSNNNHAKLRTNLNKMNYTLVEERIVLEKEHYYIVMLYKEGYQKLTKKELKFGISKNISYYEYLHNKNKKLIKTVPFKKKLGLLKDNIMLKSLIEKK